MNIVDEVKHRIEDALPGASVEVAAFSGDDHLRATVSASQFQGKGRVEQHRMVYASLEGLIGGTVHALQLETSVLDDGA